MRIFATSDLHVDYRVNKEWVDNLSLHDFKEDVLIVAGDVSDVLKLLGDTLESLTKRFFAVLYVPGNHDLWVKRSGHSSSFKKFEVIKQIVKDSGVTMDPLHWEDVSVVPLFGWYDYSFGVPDQKLKDQWMDFHCCDWQDYSDLEITEYFTDMNASRLSQSNDVVISFSHFLPRIDIMPIGVPPQFRRIYPILGSLSIDEQVAAIGSDIHVYGHSHINQNVGKDGRTYINNAFGTPSERHISAKSLYCVYGE